MSKDRETTLLLAAVASGISAKKELANFMAQTEHESLGLRRLEEGFRYTQGIHQIPVDSAWQKGPEALEAARQEARRGHPEQLADLMYGGRMGNNEPGDGFKYRGRGYIQLTGKNGYRAAGEALGLDLVNHPELATQPQHAVRIAVWYWNSNVHDISPESVKGATRIINNGNNDLPDRQARFAEWDKKLTPELMAELTQEAAVIPAERLLTSPPAASSASTEEAHQNNTQVDATKELQSRLNALGYADKHGHPLDVDGLLGARTRYAVEAFQREHDLTPNGIADRATWGKLSALPLPQEHPKADTHAAVTRLDDPGHPLHSMFKQAQGGVRQLDVERGRTSDQRSDNLAAALVVAARGHGMSRIDHVMLSTDASRVFVVEGGLNSPFKQIASASTVESLDRPIADSSRELDHVMSFKTQEHKLPQSSRDQIVTHAQPNAAHATAI
jgi:putative chitinase